MKRSKVAAAVAALSSNEDIRPEFADVQSLVLDQRHPLSDLYFRRARYKVYWGGRGSAKSWGIAEALIRLTASQPLRVLCVREFQNSIKDSSHKLLRDTINRLGMQGWFTVTADMITSRSGAEFIFKGMHNNEQGIKSTEGIDICWVEEAQTVPASSWRTLTPTIRKEDSEIWVSYNLIDEDDATHQRFVVKGRHNSIVHKINYDSNPYFGGVLRDEMEEDRESDYHLYEHIWLGMPLRLSNAIVYSGKYREANLEKGEFPDDLWRQADRVFLGNDFGFSQDPLALIRFFIIETPTADQLNPERRLYIESECYGVGIEIDEMAARYRSDVPGVDEWPIKADAARPEVISHLRRKGFNISAAEKWEGCVKDGVAHIRGFKEIIVHPRCVNTLREFRLYRYKVDKNVVDDKGQPQVLPIIVDKNNHAMDAIMYGLDGYIQRSGAMGQWAKLGKQANGDDVRERSAIVAVQ